MLDAERLLSISLLLRRKNPEDIFTLHVLEQSGESAFLTPHHHVRRSRRFPDVLPDPEMFPDDFESLTLWEPLPPNIMDLVMADAATREQLWVLEGVLYRKMHAVSSVKHKDVFVCLWFAVYRARRGVQAPSKAFELSRKVSKQVAYLQPPKLPVTLPPSEIEYHCSEAWVSLLLYISKLRARYWRNAADVLKGVEHSTERFPFGAASGEGGYSGEIPPVFGEATRGSANERDIEQYSASPVNLVSSVFESGMLRSHRGLLYRVM
ncbi:hypothetical protein Q7P35_005574 [Cladosporium inversicolor]